MFEFDVITAHHDDIKGGGTFKTVHSRVVVSDSAFPDWRIAAQVAGCMAMAIHGGMATDILPRY